MPKVNFDESSLYQVIGSNIRLMRESRPLSQNQLAKMMGLTRASLSNIESGKQRVSLHNLYIICHELSCRLSDIIPRDEDIAGLFRPLSIELPSESLRKALLEEQDTDD